jgi:hypothetical protein
MSPASALGAMEVLQAVCGEKWKGSTKDTGARRADEANGKYVHLMQTINPLSAAACGDRGRPSTCQRRRPVIVPPLHWLCEDRAHSCRSLSDGGVATRNRRAYTWPSLTGSVFIASTFLPSRRPLGMAINRTACSGDDKRAFRP